MPRSFLYSLAAVALLAPALAAQEPIRRGRIKTIDADKGTLTLTSEGKDYACTVTPRSRIWDSGHQIIKDGLKDQRFRKGAPVLFKVETSDGRTVLVGIQLGGRGPAGPGGNIPRARVQKVDPDQNRVTLTVNGKDQEFTVTEHTNIRDFRGQPVKDRLKDKRFKKGAPVMFLARKQDGREVLIGLMLQAGPQPKVDTSKLKPLPELGTGRYQGSEGGLYPGGKNEPPPAHARAGLAFARQVKPRDAAGKPDPDGKIVLLSVGMSNTTQEFSTFQRVAAEDAARNPKLMLVDGAQGGMTAKAIRQADEGPGRRYWREVDRRLRQAGVTRAQVQAAWIKEADAGPTEGFPKYARTLEEELGDIVRLLHGRFPNLKLVYLSGRTYGGYARTPLNPEPYAYESGFAVKWLIGKQIQGDPSLNDDPDKGPVRAPWLGWGPYLWANGTRKNADGLAYAEEDFGPDGTHPSASGRRKVAGMLLRFFKTEATARPWFVGR